MGCRNARRAIVFRICFAHGSSSPAFFLAPNACVPKTPAGTSDPEVVLGIQGKDVLDEHPTTSAERQTFEVIRLYQAARNAIRHLVGTDFGVADSETADLRGRGDIT